MHTDQWVALDYITNTPLFDPNLIWHDNLRCRTHSLLELGRVCGSTQTTTQKSYTASTRSIWARGSLNHTGCISLAFLHCVFLNVSTNNQTGRGALRQAQDVECKGECQQANQRAAQGKSQQTCQSSSKVALVISWLGKLIGTHGKTL